MEKIIYSFFVSVILVLITGIFVTVLEMVRLQTDLSRSRFYIPFGIGFAFLMSLVYFLILN